jgi:hypothetical protein
MYTVQRVFFERLAADPEIGPQLQRSQLVIRFQVRDPDGVVTIDCRATPPPGQHIVASLGPSAVKPDLTLSSSADFGHEFWLGRANIVNSLLSGKTRAEGDVTQAMKIMPILKPVQALYKRTLKSLGREDLIPK